MKKKVFFARAGNSHVYVLKGMHVHTSITTFHKKKETCYEISKSVVPVKTRADASKQGSDSIY